MSEQQEYLRSINTKLESLVEKMNRVLQESDWQAIVDLDRDVNTIVCICVEEGQVGSPEINQKILSLVALYRQLIKQLQNEQKSIYSLIQAQKNNSNKC